MTGIGFVSSDPSYRGGGRIDQLMTQMLTDCKEQGILFSYLAPFSYAFYRRYGYELLFERISYQVASRDWPDSPRVAGQVKRKDWQAAKNEIKAIYQAATKNKHGGLVRDDWWYEYKFQIQRPYYFVIYYDQENQAQGYLIYQIKDGIFHCAEWECLTGDAYRGLNRYIASHKDSTREIHYEKGYTQTSSFYLQEHPLANAVIRPEMMVRIVDIEKFLNIYPFENLSQPFALVIEEDSYAPWNEGIFEVFAVNEVKKVTVTHLPTVKLSVQRLTQLFLGYKSLQELRFFDYVEVDEAQAVAHIQGCGLT